VEEGKKMNLPYRDDLYADQQNIVGSRKAFWKDDDETPHVSKSPLFRIDKSKNNFYKQLNVDKHTRSCIKLYNWIKEKM